MKGTWIWYVFLLILAGILVRNAAGSVALLLAGGNVSGGIIGALEGPASSPKGSFSFGNTKIALG